MNVITSPSVYLVGHQSVREEGLNEFLSDHRLETWETDTEVAGQKLVEVAGRLCYMSFAKPRPGGNEAYMKNIKESGHGSVMEHAVYNFIISGVSRSFTHELVRHRAGFGYSQLSQRYVDESVAEYVCPAAIVDDPDAFDVWERSCFAAHEAYMQLCNLLLKKEKCRSCGGSLIIEKHGIRCSNCNVCLNREEITAIRKNVRQAARSVLPNATETKIFVTVNARALRHFIELRGTKFAEPEIRMVAGLMFEEVLVAAPNFFGDYGMETGYIETPFKKI